MKWVVLSMFALLVVTCSCGQNMDSASGLRVRISPASLHLHSGESVQLYAAVYDSEGNVVLLPDVFTPGDGKFWSVTNMNGGEISADGQFTAKWPGSYPGLVALTYIHGGSGIHQTVYADVEIGQ